MKNFLSLFLSGLVILLISCSKDPSEETPATNDVIFYDDYYFNAGSHTICRTDDNGFVIVAPITNHQMKFIKVNPNFQTVVEKKLNIFLYNVSGIIETSDHNFVILGQSSDTTAWPHKPYISLNKLDQNGSVLWEKKYYFRYQDENDFGFCETPDKGFIISAAHDDINNQGLIFPVLFKTNENGDSLWVKEFRGYSHAGHTIRITSDNGFIFTGEGLIIKSDSSGNKVWESYSDSHYKFKDLLTLNDGSFIVCGRKIHSGIGQPGNDDMILVKLDASGTAQWENKYDVQYDDQCSNICETDDGFLLTGVSELNDYSNYVSVIIRTDALGNKIGEEISSPVLACEARGIFWLDHQYIYFGGRANGMQYYLYFRKKSI